MLEGPHNSSHPRGTHKARQTGCFNSSLKESRPSPSEEEVNLCMQVPHLKRLWVWTLLLLRPPTTETALEKFSEMEITWVEERQWGETVQCETESIERPQIYKPVTAWDNHMGQNVVRPWFINIFFKYQAKGKQTSMRWGNVILLPNPWELKKKKNRQQCCSFYPSCKVRTDLEGEKGYIFRFCFTGYPIIWQTLGSDLMTIIVAMRKQQVVGC